MRYFLWVWLLLINSCFSVVRADVPLFGLPEVEWYNRRHYKGGTQNWAVSQSPHGLLYVANNDGVLEYDGSFWRKLPQSVPVISRSVLAEKELVYMGAYNELGFYAFNGENDWRYASLRHHIPVEDVGDVWKILVFGEEVVFQADKGLAFLRGKDSLRWVPAATRITRAFLVKERLFVSDENAGLMEYVDGQLKTVKGGEDFSGVSIGALFDLGDEGILVGTITEGLYLWDEEGFRSWQTPVSDLLNRSNVFCGASYGQDELVFGTIQSGVVVSDRKGNIRALVDKDRGLSNNTVLSLEIDQEGNIWAGLDNGIARIAYHSTISFLQGYYDIGTGYAAAFTDEQVYLGTNQSLYRVDKKDFVDPVKDRSYFKRIEGTAGQVWSLFEDEDGALLCGHNSGVFAVRESQATLITPPSVVGAWIFRYLPGRSDRLLVGAYNGFFLLEKRQGQWHFLKTLEGFSRSARFMEWAPDGSLWVTHGYLGAFRVYFDSEYETIKRVEAYNDVKGLDKDLALNVSKVRGELVFSSLKGVFGYDEGTESFYRHHINSYFLEEGFPSFLKEDDKHNLWFFNARGAGVLRRMEDGSFVRQSAPFYPMNGRLVNGFEYLYVVDSNNALFGVEDGFAHYTVNSAKEFAAPFNVHLRGFRNLQEGPAYFVSTSLVASDPVPEWSFSNNAFEVSYSATYFEKSGVRYATFIEGFDQGWSAWTDGQSRQFTNLREGSYIFHVKARNVYGVESPVLSFAFKISPPWYRTILARVVYVILMLLLAWGAWYLMGYLMARSRQMATERQKEHFRIKEEQLKNEALEKEKEMIRLRNEKLRNEMVFKEKELANSTMGIIQKNEFLVSLKEDLLKAAGLKEGAGLQRRIHELVRRIDKDIDNDAHWEVFELHLEQVHADFLKRLRERFPDLSSREQKLCAYLRMDMASKEISSLMNISVRAVENNRYKLRQKLGLEGKDNLSDFIMSI
ncbi:triple tyrosine motif-containing protein [Geofilum rhodophaeum]|uniref:triple tyrosine motif-containing protein n=1 Tax=Geofilum rhodophaeum TaxID=1965019 RepID=UPI00131461AC|nr:triple tyrosine motif-containing protein [Geofilum rhodophaeum]